MKEIQQPTWPYVCNMCVKDVIKIFCLDSNMQYNALAKQKILLHFFVLFLSSSKAYYLVDKKEGGKTCERTACYQRFRNFEPINIALIKSLCNISNNLKLTL